AREHATAAGHPSLARIVQGTVCKILTAQEVRPHKVRYYLERRDEAFEAKMGRGALRLPRGRYPEAERCIRNRGRNHLVRRKARHPSDRQHCTRPAATTRRARDFCAGPRIPAPWHTSLLAGIDLLTGRVHARV